MTSVTINGVRISFGKGGMSYSVPVSKGVRIRKNMDNSTSITMSNGNTTIHSRQGKR